MTQKMVNIPSTIQDPSYRYKMPKIITKIEGKGNGIKVNLVNLEDVAKALRVPIQCKYKLILDPLKYMGYELGSQTIYKKNGNEVQTIINGSFREEQIIEYLDKFISKYVVCSKCTYPEIKMTIKKGQIYGNCAACGVSNELDNKHRLAEFIKKNPPNDQTDFKNQKQVQTNQQQIENELFRQTDNFNTKLYSMIQELKTIYNQFSGSVETFDEDQDENFEKLLTYLKNKNLDIPAKSHATYIFFAAIFDTLTEASIQKNSYLIKKFFEFLQFKEDKSMAYTMINLQKFLLESDIVEPQKYIPSIVKHFYDEDIFTEDFLIDWSENMQKKQLTKHKFYKKENNKIFVTNSHQLIEWLKD